MSKRSESLKKWKHQERKRQRLERRLLEKREKTTQEPQEKPLGQKYLEKYFNRYHEIFEILEKDKIKNFEKKYSTKNPSKEQYDDLVEEYRKRFY